MPLRLDIKRKLSARSDRVKGVDLHPTEPWMLCSLYNGNVNVWNYETETLIKTFEVADLPVRACRFVARKNWIVTGSDDMLLRVFNYNTLEKVQTLEAHSDYVRSIAVHPVQPYLLTCSDDQTIKLWDWERWACVQTFQGHGHFVMMVVFNPKDTNTFASASLDRTIKVWQLGSPTPNFTLEGHEKGVNCVDYYQGGEKPYLISGGDDGNVKVWDYQNKVCVQTLAGHTQNVSVACFHPDLPIIISGSEDGTVRIWHAQTYRMETTLNYGLERVWALAYQRGSNDIAFGFDEGSIMIKMGREEPAMSMDQSGKIIWAKHSEILQANVANIKGAGDVLKDGEQLTLPTKDLGSCEVYPQTLSHNPNGRFVVVCGDGEYIIYTALAWRNKSFGSALEFVWSADAGEYAVRESSSKVKLYRNFKERQTVKIDFSAEGLFGGHLVGVRSANSLAFYDWETTNLVRRIEIVPKQIFWNESGELCAIVTEDSYYVLKYNKGAVAAHVEQNLPVPDEGIEEAFDVLGEVQEVVKTATWVGDCFLYTSSVNRLNYYVGGEIVTVAHLDKPMYLLGYLPKEGRCFLADKDVNVVSYALNVTVLEYQTQVMRRDFAAADALMANIPKEQRTRVARFLEKQGFPEQALQVSEDSDHRFELALGLKKLDVAYGIAKEAESDLKWKQLGDLALSCWNFGLAEECMIQAKDYGGLLLLFTTAGNVQGLSKLAEVSRQAGRNNVTFVCLFLLQRLEDCLQLLVDTERLPEAAFFAKTYLPSQITRVVQLWKEALTNAGLKKAADALADPAEYENLFPDLELALQAEEQYRAVRQQPQPASAYPSLRGEMDRNLLEEARHGGVGSEHVHVADKHVDTDDDVNLDEELDVDDDAHVPDQDADFDDEEDLLGEDDN
eukprot:comp19305_c0_seq1/m.22166 comp19305_c0_seq1/g.22166  ORF comp19305_c0_seq1/g.22166 comp19305_c0_seq1/m.22166 type:complete len:898 (-) comp19305_c0_seq1:632-3325(-)